MTDRESWGILERFLSLFRPDNHLKARIAVLEQTSREQARELEQLSADVAGLALSLKKLRGRVTGGTRNGEDAPAPATLDVEALNDRIRRGERF